MDGSAEGIFSIRAVRKEGSTSLQTLSENAAFVLRVSLVDANPPRTRRLRSRAAEPSIRPC